MRNIYFVVLITVFFSCKKSNDLIPAEILMSNDWYPYKNEYKTVDSSFTYPVTDPYGTPQVAVTLTDSAALFSNCGQQSIYSFEDAGVLTITNTCSGTAPVFTTTWQLSQTNKMSMYTGSTSYIYGPLTDLSNDHFVLSVTSFYYSYYSGNNGQTAAVGHRVYTTVSTTFKRH